MNVTFSKNSWHYKFNDWMDCSDFFVRSAHCTLEVNLCNYFWKTVWNILLFVIQTIVSIFLGLGVGYIMAMAPFILLGVGEVDGKVNISLIPYFWWWSWTAGYLFLGVCLVTVYSAGLTIEFCSKKLKKFFRKEREEQTSNLVISWVKAKKHKYCPVINWKENNHE